MHTQVHAPWVKHFVIYPDAYIVPTCVFGLCICKHRSLYSVVPKLNVWSLQKYIQSTIEFTTYAQSGVGGSGPRTGQRVARPPARRAGQEGDHRARASDPSWSPGGLTLTHALSAHSKRDLRIYMYFHVGNLVGARGERSFGVQLRPQDAASRVGNPQVGDKGASLTGISAPFSLICCARLHAGGAQLWARRVRLHAVPRLRARRARHRAYGTRSLNWRIWQSNLSFNHFFHK